MGKTFIILGLTIFFVGVILYFFGDKISWFGNLYGDIKIVKSQYRIYFPITSMLAISILASFVLNIFFRFFK